MKRKIGQWEVEVSEQGHIAIVGNYHSNHGVIYTHAIDRWLDYYNNDLHTTFSCPQLIGMDNTYGLTKSVKNWIYSLVVKGKVKP